MKHLRTDTEWEEAYAARDLTLLCRLSRGPRLLTINRHRLQPREIWLRQDEPDAAPFMRKLTFDTAAECEEYLTAKREELESEGWRDEVNS